MRSDKSQQQVQSRLQELAKQHPSLGLDKWQVVKSNSDMYAVRNPETKEVVISYRGTNPKNVRDLGNDLAIATGFGSPRGKAATQFAQDVMKQNPGYKVTVTGHSLGGTIAEQVATNLKGQGVNGVTFNPGSSPFNSPTKQDNIKSYHIQGDTISRFGTAGDKVTLPRETYVPLGNHGVGNFLDRWEKGGLERRRL